MPAERKSKIWLGTLRKFREDVMALRQLETSVTQFGKAFESLGFRLNEIAQRTSTHSEEITKIDTQLAELRHRSLATDSSSPGEDRRPNC